MRKNNLLNPGNLLDKNGNLTECGYATTLIKNFNRENLKTSKLKLKQWDYYYLGDENFGVAVTIDDNGYMGLTSVSLLDFKNKIIYEASKMFAFPLGKVNMPVTSETGDVSYKQKGFDFNFYNNNGSRHLVCKVDNLKGKEFSLDVYLEKTTPHSMVIVTPFLKRRHFYYNQKINNLKVSGHFCFGDLKYDFNQTAYGVLDWGRGVWTYSNTWYWSSLNGFENGHHIGFNLGYGFGDTSNASENIVFYDQEVYKLGDIVFDIPKENNKLNFIKPWKIYDDEGLINLNFYPIIDRHAKINALILGQDSHQVFGYFNGEIKTKEKIIKINHLLGFAEKVKNRW